MIYDILSSNNYLVPFVLLLLSEKEENVPLFSCKFSSKTYDPFKEEGLSSLL